MRAAYFSDFMGDCRQETLRRQRIEAHLQELAGRKLPLLAVMGGDFLQNGTVAAEAKDRRIRKGLASGVQALVELSCFAALSSVGIFAFSAARVLDKLGGVELLALETREASLEQLTEISYLLIANDRQFQQRVSFFKEQGQDFYRAQARAVGERIPGGEEIMNCWDNLFAVECIKSLKLMYSGIRCVCVPLAREPGLFSWWEPGDGMLERMDQLLKYQLYFSEMQMSDIYGGYEQLTNHILEERDTYDGFFNFAHRLAGSQDLYDVRKYLLRLLCGISKSTVGIWRMYDFAPYLCLHVKEEETARELAEHSKVFLLSRGLTGAAPDVPESAAFGKEWVWTADGAVCRRLERSKEELLQLERRTQKICGLLI